MLGIFFDILNGEKVYSLLLWYWKGVLRFVFVVVFVRVVVGVVFLVRLVCMVVRSLLVMLLGIMMGVVIMYFVFVCS